MSQTKLFKNDLGVFKKKYEVCHKSASFWQDTCYSLSFAGSLYFLPQTSKDETVVVNVRRGGFGSGQTKGGQALFALFIFNSRDDFVVCILRIDFGNGQTANTSAL